MWDPGFPFVERVIAELRGWERRFCMSSIHYRGTVENPGLVLALDENPQARCTGIAFRVSDEAAAETLDILRARELISYAYLETQLTVDLANGDQVRAVTYVINRKGEQYQGALSIEAQARQISQAVGSRGRNCDYLFATLDHLQSIGIEDAYMADLAVQVRQEMLGR